LAKSKSSDSVSSTIKKAFQKTEWWEFVQEEVKKKINEEIDYIITSGPAFRDAFVSGFTYEHNRRMRENIAVNASEPGVFGMSLSNECYHSAISSAKSLLHLDEWTLPNDADIQACIYLCQQVELFESLGLNLKSKKDIKFPKI